MDETTLNVKKGNWQRNLLLLSIGRLANSCKRVICGIAEWVSFCYSMACLFLNCSLIDFAISCTHRHTQTHISNCRTVGCTASSTFQWCTTAPSQIQRANNSNTTFRWCILEETVFCIRKVSLTSAEYYVVAENRSPLTQLYPLHTKQSVL